MTENTNGDMINLQPLLGDEKITVERDQKQAISVVPVEEKEKPVSSLTGEPSLKAPPQTNEKSNNTDETTNQDASPKDPPAVLLKKEDDADNEDGEVYDDDEGDDGNLNSKWEETFKRLAPFKEKHGHCLVPNRYHEDPQLGSWVSTQRRQYKIFASGSDQSTPMTAERARRLEGLGFQWSTRDPRHVPWEKRYGELIDFIERYGHSQVPIGWKENIQLSNWVSTQRQEYKLMQKGRTTRLTQDRIELLNKIHFVWEAQRGGPRRQRRATVSVPAKANPVGTKTDKVKNSLTSTRGGKSGSLGATTSTAPTTSPQVGQPFVFQPPGTATSTQAGQPFIFQPPGNGAAFPFAGQPFLFPGGMLPSQQVASLGVTNIPDPKQQPAPATTSSSNNASTEAVKEEPSTTPVEAATASNASAAASAPQPAPQPYASMMAPGSVNLQGMTALSPGFQQPRSLAELGMFGPAGQQLMGPPWHMLPNGAFQQAGPMGLGIFPIATPLPIAAAGYQLGMIPTSMMEGGAGAFLRHPMFQQKVSKKKKRKKHKSKKKKKKVKKEDKPEEKESDDASSSSDDDEDDDEDDNEDESS